MLINIIRALFIVIIVAVMFVNINKIGQSRPFPVEIDESMQQLIKIGETGNQAAKQAAKELVDYMATQNYEKFIAAVLIGLAVVIIAIAVDWLTPKKSLTSLAGIFFGLLVGIFISWAMSWVLDMINKTYSIDMGEGALQTCKLIIGVSICYLVIIFVIRTKDDFRFVIPYVEFTKQTKGQRPLVLDTSVIIDGRIADLCQTKLFDAPLVVPKFVLNELQLIADSADKLKRNRGRRGLDMLNKLQTNSLIEVQIDDTHISSETATDVDQKLLVFTKNVDGRLVTNDYNLSKVAMLRAVDIINVNDLANALKPVVLPGEAMQIKIIKPGEEAQQGIGYLDDGTMVVVEDAREYIGQMISVIITSSLQTSAGRMIFAKCDRGSQSGDIGLSNGGSRRYGSMQRKKRFDSSDSGS
jgi:uncharacterized protein YacL